MPWSQVVANERLGFLVTESGGGYTWFENSRENKLTTWSNDPVSDSPSEVLYVLDEQTGHVHLPMSVSRADNRDGSPAAWARYGAGFAEFEKRDTSFHFQTLLAISSHDPVKFIRLRLANITSVTTRTVVVSYYAELVLGVNREQSHWHLRSEFDEAQHSLLRNTQSVSSRIRQPNSFREPIRIGESFSHTADRAEFLGRNGSWENAPGAASVGLNRRTGIGWDPCAALQARAELQPGETREFIFLLGAGEDDVEARELMARYCDASIVEREQQDNRQQWRQTLSKIQVKTPDRALDVLVNNWLIYQVLCCRMWGRSAFYQAGGAFGFRDQLQDCMALVYSRPNVVRAHILLAASRPVSSGRRATLVASPVGQRHSHTLLR